MKYLIAGLGNVGAEYTYTRHNIGFVVVDHLAREAGAMFTLDKQAYKTEMKYKGRTLILIKTTTYMNLSGKAINLWLQQEKIPLENLLVIADDIALPFGTLRLKPNGSDGGHNGLASIAATLNTVNYNRLRFGVGNDFAKGKQSEYVLGEWTEEEKNGLVARVPKSCDAVKSFVSIGLPLTMTNFNGK